MERIAKRKPVGMVIAALGALLFVIAVASGGGSVVAPKTAESVSELETAAAHGGGLYRPFVKAEFDYATFSGLYLSDEDDLPQMWVMWGFRDDAAVCFYLSADGEDTNGDGVFDSGDAPEDIWGVEYVLRGAQASLHEHSEWVLGESIGDTAAYYGMTEDEAAVLFADGVLEAARSALATMQVAFWVGLVMIAAGTALLVMPEETASVVARALARVRGAGREGSAPSGLGRDGSQPAATDDAVPSDTDDVGEDDNV